ncbi:Hypothetical predicted protein, partial [Podarcis lilfordi]
VNNLHQKLEAHLLELQHNLTLPPRDLKRQRCTSPVRHESGTGVHLLKSQLDFQSLILQPNKICLTIRSSDPRSPRWINPREVKDHLRQLLQIRPPLIDLSTVKLLYYHHRFQKVLLSFQSPKIPSILVRRKALLATWGIFPTRVFNDTRTKPLFRSIVQKGIRSPDRRDIVLKLKLSTQEPHPPSQPKLPGLSTPATEKHDQSGPSHLASSEERDLISSYGELPLVEQQEVINRLDTLKQQLTHVLQEKISSKPGHSNLLNQRNAVMKGLTPQKPLPITGTPITDDMAVCLAEAPHTPSQRRPSSPLLIDLQSTTSSLALKSNMPNTIHP